MKKKLLVVDNDETTRRLCKKIFKGEFYDTFVASDSGEAFRLLERVAIDLVLLNQVLPDKSGIEVLESIPIDADTGAAAHGVPYSDYNSPVPRQEVSQKDPHRNAILNQAPELEDGYIVVPDISHEELD